MPLYQLLYPPPEGNPVEQLKFPVYRRSRAKCSALFRIKSPCITTSQKRRHTMNDSFPLSEFLRFRFGYRSIVPRGSKRRANCRLKLAYHYPHPGKVSLPGFFLLSVNLKTSMHQFPLFPLTSASNIQKESRPLPSYASPPSPKPAIKIRRCKPK